MLLKDGSKHITVRSHVQIQNFTKKSVEIQYEKAGQLGVFREPLRPKEIRSVPVELAESTIFRFRPSNDVYSWSNQQISVSTLQNELGTHLFKCPSVPSQSFFYLVKITGDKQGFDSEQYTITLLSPLVIENLLCYEMKFKILDTSTTEEGKSSIYGAASGGEESLHEVDFAERSTSIRISVPTFSNSWSNAILIEATDEYQTAELFDEKKRPLNLQVEIRYAT